LSRKGIFYQQRKTSEKKGLVKYSNQSESRSGGHRHDAKPFGYVPSLHNDTGHNPEKPGIAPDLGAFEFMGIRTIFFTSPSIPAYWPRRIELDRPELIPTTLSEINIH
jgi:hypothetical protein